MPGMEALDGTAEMVTSYSFPKALTKPVIGAINEPAVGAGFVIAASCDIRVAAGNAFLAAAFGQRGRVPKARLHGFWAG